MNWGTCTIGTSAIKFFNGHPQNSMRRPGRYCKSSSIIPGSTEHGVFQEVVCASRPVVQCGQYQISFPIFSLFAVIVYTNGLIPFLSSGQSRSALHRLAMMQTVRRRYDRGHREPLFKLLLATRGGLAHDPRDLLFSLAGIAKGDQPLPYHPRL